MGWRQLQLHQMTKECSQMLNNIRFCFFIVCSFIFLPAPGGGGGGELECEVPPHHGERHSAQAVLSGPGVLGHCHVSDHHPATRRVFILECLVEAFQRGIKEMQTSRESCVMKWSLVYNFGLTILTLPRSASSSSSKITCCGSEHPELKNKTLSLPSLPTCFYNKTQTHPPSV